MIIWGYGAWDQQLWDSIELGLFWNSSLSEVTSIMVTAATTKQLNLVRHTREITV